jgi:hypothetical protein
MIQARFESRRSAVPPAGALAVAVLLLLAAAPPPATPAPGAAPPAGQPAAAGKDSAPPPQDALTTTDAAAPLQDVDVSIEPPGCQPPSTQQWLLIGAGTIVIFVGCFLLLVRVVQRRFINQDWSATLGRHSGISLTLLLGSGGMVLLTYLITGCLHRRFLLWLLFPLALWLIHGFYILVVVRGKES